MRTISSNIWLMPMISVALIACSSTPPTASNPPPAAPRIVTAQPQAIPPQKVFKPSFQPPSYSSAFSQPDEYSDVFPKPVELVPAVEFWRKVYVKWYRSEIVFHDDRFLNVVYEVLSVPGEVGDRLTDEQKAVVNERRQYWQDQLALLESKLRYKAPLTAHERRLASMLQNTGAPLSHVVSEAYKRVRAQRGNRERFIRGLEISRRYDTQFRKIFREAGLPEDLAYLPHVESSFQPSARSSAGAVGMWQFTKAAAKTFMPSRNGEDLRQDPYASAVGAARYLSYAYRKLGDWPTALTAYNHGIGGMRRAQNEAGPDFVSIVQNYNGRTFGFASRNYYAQFLAAREIANNWMMQSSR